ncbi:arylsulfatase B-like [Ornithodoros turicata]|uniref:arylsulfatase B-like n=1 Tax=Ornithodoros turicata TaxID=34597 RepID=UPI003138DC10
MSTLMYTGYTAFLLLVTSIRTISTARPHIVLILADDLGWNDVSWHNPEMKTPNLEALANEGVFLDQNYVQPVCTPTRTALMTGMYPYHLGRQNHILEPLEPTGVALGVPFLPEKLRDLGYVTHAVGKWHLGYCNWAYTPTFRGFDSFLGFYLGSQDYYEHKKYIKSTPLIPGIDQMLRVEEGYDFRNNTKIAWEYQDHYSTYIFADTARSILATSSPEQPLFMYLPFQAPHAPLQVPQKYEDLYRNIHDSDRRKYCGMVTALDDAVGAIVDALKNYGYWNNTLLVFLSDNGGQILNGGNNWPLRGNKGTLWEGGTRVPAFVSGPLLKKRGYTNHKLIHAVDWFPTLVKLAGGDVGGRTDGVDQWRVISHDGPAARNEFVYNLYDHHYVSGALRVGDYKLIRGFGGYPDGWYPPPKSNGTGRRCYETPKNRLALYNVRVDPEERHDLAAELPDIVQKLQHQLLAHARTMVPADDPPQDPSGDPDLWGGVFSPGWCHAH